MFRFIKEWIRAALPRRRAKPSSDAESAPADEAATDNVGSTPDEQSTDTDVSTLSEPTAKSAIPDAVGVELQRRFNEFERRFNERQSEILDARAAYIERWLVAISVVAVVGGYLGFTKFDKIEDEARQHVTAAKQYAEKAQILVEKIEAKYGESVSLVAEHKRLTAETVDNNPDEAGRAAKRIQEDPAASLIDRAMAATVQLQLQGEIEKAAEKWRAIIHISEGSDNDLAARAYFSVGYLLIQQGKPEDAITAYDKAIRLKRNFAEAYNDRGNAMGDLGRHEDAIDDYDQAIQLKPDLAEAYNNRGVAKSKLDRHKDAIDDCSQAIQLKPDFAEAYYNRGNAMGDLGRHEDAIDDYDQAIQLKSDYIQAYHNRGVAKSKLDRHKDAIDDYDQAIQLKSDHVQAYHNRGVAKSELDRHKDAIDDYDQAIQLKPDFAEAYYNRGLEKSKLGRIDEARQDFEKARDLARKADNTRLVFLAEQGVRKLDSQKGE